MLALVSRYRNVISSTQLSFQLPTAQLASASPIRITVTEVSALRFGHAMAQANNDNAPVIVHVGRPGVMISNQDGTGRSKRPHRHSCGGALRSKAIDITNTIRKALGMSLIEDHAHPIISVKQNHDGLARILPIHFVGAPATEDEINERHHRVKHHNASFMRRINHALTALGPWEGRAVAFVLGT